MKRFLIAFALLGCQARAAEPERSLAAPFIALERDFQDFERWPKIDLSNRPRLSETHAAGDAHEYINRQPPSGATSFPIGTILVKSVSKGAREQDIFAMVKRGGGYNAQGSPGWEWFELRRRPDDSLGIVWRGVNPPSGEGYSGDPMGGCNGCHQMATNNDYVLAEALSLAKR